MRNFFKNLKNKKVWLNVVVYFLPLAVAITLVLGTVYTLGQQVYRMSANDPQIQMSEDIADKLAQGTPFKNVLPNDHVDISRSLSLYVMLFDDSGNLLSANANIGGSAPNFPKGVFDYAKVHGQDMVTWQPEPGVRQATVVTYFSGSTSGYVLVGRSLREVEIRENNLLYLTVIAWVFSLLATFFVLLFLNLISGNIKK